MERLLLRTPPRLTLAVALAALAAAASRARTAPHWPRDAVLGLVLYSFFEYAIHRGALHILPMVNTKQRQENEQFAPVILC